MVCIMCPSSVFLSLSKNTRDWKRPGQSYFHYKLDCRSHEKTFLPDLSWRARNFFHRDLGNLYSLLQLGVCVWRLLQHTQSKKNSHARQKARAPEILILTLKNQRCVFCADLAKCQRSFYFHKSYLPEYLFLYFRRMFFSVLLLFVKSLMYKFFRSNPLSVEKTVLCSLFSLSDISTSPRQIGFTVFLCLSLLLLLNLSHWQKNRRI